MLRGRRTGSYRQVCTVLAVLALIGSLATPARAAECRTEPGGAGTVVRIIDSETIALDDGREVRLAGVLGPRAGDVGAVAGTWKAEIDAVTTLEAAALGHAVTLGFGPVRKDRHGRVVAHVYVGEKSAGSWLQRVLVEAGAARVYGFGSDPACAGELASAEDRARQARTGLWQESAYAVRGSSQRQAWGRLDGTFQVVELDVGRVWTSRDGHRFMPMQRTAGQVTVIVKRTDRELLGALGGDPKALQGRRLQARGWVVARRDRPQSWEIDASSGGGLRLLATTEDGRQENRREGRRARPNARSEAR